MPTTTTLCKTRAEEQERRSRRRWGKPKPNHDFHTFSPTYTRVRGRRSPRNQSGWSMFLTIGVLVFSEKQSVRNVSARRSLQLVPVTPQSGVGSQCPPARAVVRAVSYGSALEFCALQVRLSHCRRARSEAFAVVLLYRAAWMRWLSAVIIEAAAVHCFMLCLKEHRSQIQNLSFFHATQNSEPAGKPILSRPQKILLHLASASPLAPQLYRCSTGFPPAWRTIFVILKTPTRLVGTNLRSLL